MLKMGGYICDCCRKIICGLNKEPEIVEESQGGQKLHYCSEACHVECKEAEEEVTSGTLFI